MTVMYHSMFHQYPPRALSYDPQKIDLEMHLEHLGDSSVWAFCEQWRLSAARTRVSIGFTHPCEDNGVDDLMPRSTVSKSRCDAPMNRGTLRVLASSEIIVPNPNKMWYLENEIGYFRPPHDHTIEFDISSIAPMSFELRSSKDVPWNALRAPWRLFGTGWSWMMEALCGQKKGVTRVHLPI